MESYFSRCASVLLSVRSLTATISRSTSEFWMTRYTFRPIRPKPLIATRMVTMPSSGAPVSPARVICSLTDAYGGVRAPGRTATSDPQMRQGYTGGRSGASGRSSSAEAETRPRQGLRTRPSDVQHVRGQVGLGVGDAEFLGALVGGGQQTPDPPGDRILGQRRVGQLTELLQGCLLVLQAQPPGPAQVVRHLVAEDLERAVHPDPRGDRGTGRPAQVGVVEVGQAVRGATHLPAHPTLLPDHHRVVRAEPGEHRADRVAVPDDHPVDAANLAGLGRDAEPTRRAHQGQRRLGPGTGDLQGSRAPRFGEGAVCQERSAAGRLGLAYAAGDDLGGQATYRPPPVVQ